MKASLSINGVITLEPETEVEAYAMKYWSQESWVMQEDPARRENGHWRGSKMLVSYNCELTGYPTHPIQV
jgi:hypothetical protein